MRALVLLLVLSIALVAAPASAHEEVLRTDLGALARGAEVVARGRVVQVVLDRGSRGPRLVSVVIERVLAGEPGAQAITFRAPHEHGPGWAVGDHALFFLKRWQGGWHATAVAAESPRVGAESAAALEARWAEAVREGEGEAGGVSLPGLAAGALCFVGLLLLGRRRIVRAA